MNSILQSIFYYCFQIPTSEKQIETSAKSPVVENKIYGLGIHTSTPQLGLGISNFQEDDRFATWELGYELSSQVHHLLQEFIQPQTWKDIGFIAVGKGPGGFTGTRIGVVTARTLAQQLEIPLFTISNLAAIAWSEKDKSAQSSHSQKPLLAVEMKASRGKLFVAIFEFDSENALELKTYLSDRIMSPEDWQDTLDNLGRNYDLIKASSNLGWTVNSILTLAYLDWQKGFLPHWQDALPFYGQHPVDK